MLHWKYSITCWPILLTLIYLLIRFEDNWYNLSLLSKYYCCFLLLEWKVKVKIIQSCLTLCDPMDYTVHGILWARILEWVIIPFSRVSSQPRSWTQISHIAGRFFTSWAMENCNSDLFPPRKKSIVSHNSIGICLASSIAAI